jgi:hypothetical protein
LFDGTVNEGILPVPVDGVMKLLFVLTHVTVELDGVVLKLNGPMVSNSQTVVSLMGLITASGRTTTCASIGLPAQPLAEGTIVYCNVSSLKLVLKSVSDMLVPLPELPPVI